MKVEGFNVEHEAEEAKKFALVPPNKYNIVVDNAEDRLSSGGKDFVAFRFKIVDGEHSDRIIPYNLFDSSIRNKILFAMTRCFGLASLGDTDDFIGKTGTIKFTHTEYEGETQGEINPFRGFIPRDDNAPVEPTADKKDDEEDEPF